MLASVGQHAMRSLAAGCFGGVGVGAGIVLLSGVKDLDLQTMIGFDLGLSALKRTL